MPIEPPDPLKILDALRAALTQLLELTATFPKDARYSTAAVDVLEAIRKLEVPEKALREA